jgi:REP element-mobilizing transposase RayT
MLTKQPTLFPKSPTAYGDSYLKTRKGRECGRPLSMRDSMHFILRSTLAKGEWRLTSRRNRVAIDEILERFAEKCGVKILSYAINYNHIHLHLKLTNRRAYLKFIRAVSAAIAMKITGMSRWNKLDIKFWDRRPFSRVVSGTRDFKNVKNYIEINQLEGLGSTRGEAIRDVQKWNDRQRWLRRKLH